MGAGPEETGSLLGIRRSIHGGLEVRDPHPPCLPDRTTWLAKASWCVEEGGEPKAPDRQRRSPWRMGREPGRAGATDRNFSG